MLSGLDARFTRANGWSADCGDVKHAAKWRKLTFAMVASLWLVSSNGQIGEASQRTEQQPQRDLTSVVPSVTQESATCKSQNGCTGPLTVLRETGYAHVEINLTRQRLFIVDDSGRVVKTLPVSSGSGKWFTSEGRRRRAITPTGEFTVYRKIAGWRKSPLGMLYYPNYIIEGVAIHGSRSVPSRPASHGCIRIPISAAKAFSDMTPIGTIVLVY